MHDEPTGHADPWRVLGLDPGADAEAIQRAYRKLVRRFPPELAGERFAKIQEAYETLRSPGRLLAEARNRPVATLESLFPTAGLDLAPEGEPPTRTQGEYEDLMSSARRHVALTLVRSLGSD